MIVISIILSCIGVKKMDSLIVLVIYLVPALFIVWFMVSVVSLLREQNQLLRQLINKINKEDH